MFHRKCRKSSIMNNAAAYQLRSMRWVFKASSKTIIVPITLKLNGVRVIKMMNEIFNWKNLSSWFCSEIYFLHRSAFSHWCRDIGSSSISSEGPKSQPSITTSARNNYEHCCGSRCGRVIERTPHNGQVVGSIPAR